MNAVRGDGRKGRSSRVLIVSNTPGWGGSEELWRAAAITLADDGHSVTIFRYGGAEGMPRPEELRARCTVKDIRGLPFTPGRLTNLLEKVSSPFATWTALVRLWIHLRLRRGPNLALVSQGGNTTGW